MAADIIQHPASFRTPRRALVAIPAPAARRHTRRCFWDVQCSKWIVERTGNDGEREQFAHRTLIGARQLATNLLSDCIA